MTIEMALVFALGFLAGATLQFIVMSDTVRESRFMLHTVGNRVYWVQRQWAAFRRRLTLRYRIGHPAYDGANRSAYASTKMGVVFELVRRGVSFDEARVAAQQLSRIGQFHAVRNGKREFIELTSYYR